MSAHDTYLSLTADKMLPSMMPNIKRTLYMPRMLLVWVFFKSGHKLAMLAPDPVNHLLHKNEAEIQKK